MRDTDIGNLIGDIYDKQKEQLRIKYLIDDFLSFRKENDRYTSFDYCYNHFYKFYKNDFLYELTNKDNLEKSCLHLGFYLASWGMMRGSSFLLGKSIKNLTPLIKEISKLDKNFFEIDINNYNDENINKILILKKMIINSLGIDNNPSDTLVSKIMLGIFGNVPAFDRFFKNGMKVSGFNKKSLNIIKYFYLENKNIFDKINIETLDFYTGKNSGIYYKKSKLIDMYGFMKGKS